MIKKMTTLFITFFIICITANVAFADTPTDKVQLGEPFVAVEEALLSPPMLGDNYEDEFVSRLYSQIVSTVPAVDDLLQDAYSKTSEAMEVIKDVQETLEDPMAPEVSSRHFEHFHDEDLEDSQALEGTHFQHFVEDKDEFNPREYVHELLKKGATKDIIIVRKEGKPYLRIMVYLPTPDDGELEYDGYKSIEFPNGIIYKVTEFSFDAMLPFFCW